MAVPGLVHRTYDRLQPTPLQHTTGEQEEGARQPSAAANTKAGRSGGDMTSTYFSVKVRSSQRQQSTLTTGNSASGVRTYMYRTSHGRVGVVQLTIKHVGMYCRLIFSLCSVNMVNTSSFRLVAVRKTILHTTLDLTLRKIDFVFSTTSHQRDAKRAPTCSLIYLGCRRDET